MMPRGDPSGSPFLFIAIVQRGLFGRSAKKTACDDGVSGLPERGEVRRRFGSEAIGLFNAFGARWYLFFGNWKAR
jgi:hypothetical protein